MNQPHAPNPELAAALAAVETIMKAWARADLEAVLACLHADVVYHFHVGSPPLVGRRAVGEFLEKFGSGQTEIRWRVSHAALAGERLFVEGVDDYVDPKGRRIRAPYMGVFEFSGGLVKGWRDYLDLAIPAAARQGAPFGAHLEALYGAPSILAADG